MHPEKRQVRIGHRIDQVADERGRARHELVKLATKRHDLHVAPHAIGGSHEVRLQSCAIHEHAGGELTPIGFNRDVLSVFVHRERAMAEANLGAEAHDFLAERMCHA